MTEIRDIGGIPRLAVDSDTRALVNIPFDHHKVHAGRHFTYATYDEDMDDAEVKYFVITVPEAPTEVHLVANVTGAATTLVQLFEDTTRTSTDELETSYNNNRNTTDEATLTIQLDTSTDGEDGTQIDAFSFGLDTGLGASTVLTGGGTRANMEWILKAGAVYLLKVTSNADNNNVTIRLSWYEHTPKD